MEALQLHQALVDAGMPSSGAAAKSFFRGLAQRLGIPAAAAAAPKQQLFDLLTHLLAKAPSLACSWLSDYLAVSTTLVSSDPEEAYVLQPEAMLAWAQQAAAALQQRVGAFLRAGPSARGDAVLELQQSAQALLSVAAAVQAVSSSRCGVLVCRSARATGLCTARRHILLCCARVHHARVHHLLARALFVPDKSHPPHVLRLSCICVSTHLSCLS
jgi:hypothetical protein